MYLKQMSEFIKFISDKDHTIEDILAHLVMVVMAPLNASSATISKLDNKNSLALAGRYGITSEISDKYPETFAMSDQLPITDAIKLDKIIVINSLPQWPEEYAEILGAPYSSSEAAFIAFPIERNSTPVAVAAIFFNTKITMDAEIELFIKAIANLLSLYLYPHNNVVQISRNGSRGAAHPSNENKDVELTVRQLLILRLVSEGRTNIAIGDLLKYSESTIRQETIKIFAKLGCDGRNEASEIYKEQQQKVNAAG